MHPEEVIRFWFFVPDPTSEHSLIHCPECKIDSPLRAWTEVEVYCESCGDHAGLQCPSGHGCEAIDHVWQRTPLLVTNPPASQGVSALIDPAR